MIFFFVLQANTSLNLNELKIFKISWSMLSGTGQSFPWAFAKYRQTYSKIGHLNRKYECTINSHGI